MTEVQKLAEFTQQRSFSNLSAEGINALKIRLLDSLGCAIGALEGTPIRRLKAQIDDFGGNPLVTMIGGGKTAPDRAAFYNSALVRYLDFNDCYLAKGETCHPSDNIGSVLAACEYANTDGKQLLTALAISYQIHCRLSDIAPVRDKGFDHTVQGAYAAAAGSAYALGLTVEQTSHAISIAATAYNALRVTRTGSLSNWIGLAYPSIGWTSTHSAFLAMRGMTGPAEVIEGTKGFKDTIVGDFDIDWSKENLDRVNNTIIKKFNAEIHCQSTLEGLIEMREAGHFDPEEISSIELNIFDVAFHIVGGGDDGCKKSISTKEEANHSLPYVMAAAIIDGSVLPEQYNQERILRSDIQTLLQKIYVTENSDYSSRFPEEEPCDITILFNSGEEIFIEKNDYEGFSTKPASWKAIEAKFKNLSSPFTTPKLQKDIIQIVKNIEKHNVTDLMDVLAKVSPVAY